MTAHKKNIYKFIYLFSEESRKLIHKLLGDNRKLTKYLKRFKLTSKQHIKLIYVVEAVLFNHMAEV